MDDATTLGRPKRGRHEVADGGTLTHKQSAFVHHYATGMTAKDAARAAGYAPSSCRAQAYDLLRHPQVKAELETIRQKAQERTAYKVEDAFAEAGRAVEFAQKTNNANALVRAIELRAKLHGLLTDKVEVKVDTVDVAGALADAKARAAFAHARPVIDVTPAALPAPHDAPAQLTPDFDA